MNGQPLQNGLVERSNGIPASTRRAGGLRVPTVHEALPYTPFSSIVPFNPADNIPPPLALSTPSPSYFSDTTEVINAKRMLEQLRAGAKNAEHASKRCQQTLRDVQKLLDTDSLTQFKFTKMPPRHNASKGTLQQNGIRFPALGPFAKMVMENTDVSYHYLTPESPKPQPNIQTNGDSGPIQPALNLPTPQSRPKPAEFVANGYVTPQVDQPPSASQDSRLQAVVVMNSLTPAQRSEYQYISEADTIAVAQHATPSRTRDRAFFNAHRSVIVDQRQKGDLVVQSLQVLLSGIFDAEDQMQSGAPEGSSVHANAMFATRETEDGIKLVLQPEVQARLESSVQKVSTNGRQESVDLDSLMHAQKLCESAVAEVETLSLQIGEEWSEQDAEEWLQRVTAAERGVTAARTLLRIMGAGAHIKELQSEDYLQVVLSAVRSVLEACIVPVVEDRASTHEKIRGSREEPPPNPSFVIACTHRSPLQSLLHATTKTLRTLGDFLVKCELDETSLSAIQSFCTLLIFTENASTERDSVLGIQTFETTRRCAMDVLAKDFAKYTGQRQTILDNLLMSLDKLPAAKQSARQYRLPDAKPIQLVSALLMRLVQTSATHAGESTRGKTKPAEEEGSEVDADGESADDDDDDGSVIKVSPKKKTQDQPDDLISIVKPLSDAAQNNASYIVKVLLQRALSSSKSSDEPYRKLLDIFTDDFLNVLSSSDWPSAEMLLRMLVSHLMSMVDAPKSTVPARTLALELLGTIGTGILDLQITARNAARSLDPGESVIGKHLASLVEQLETTDIEHGSLVSFDGPYRMAVEYLQARDLDDAQLRSAQGYHLMHWAFLLCGGREGSADSESGGTPRVSKDLQSKLRHMILGLHWLEDNDDYPSISTSQGRLAAMVLTLSSKLCKALNRIFSILLAAMSSEQPKVKSRALKSIVTLLEKDPSILDRNAYVLSHIFRCATDASPLVRDSAVMLIADCVRLRPALDKAVYSRVIDRTRDASTGVRKRAMKFLKDLYLGNESVKMRTSIADAVIARMHDTEESSTELARQIMEEIWFLPLLGLKLEGDAAVESKLRYSAQASLLIRTVEANEATGPVLESLIKQLVTKSKTPRAHMVICRHFVRLLSDGIIDSADISGSPDQGSILRCLAVFARACPKLFTAAQLERLEPYTQNLAKQDDLEVYRSVITILRHVMPHQPTLKPDFLQKLQTALLSSVTKLPKSELSVVVPCLWTINNMLGNTERLVNFVMSALRNVYGMRTANFAADTQAISKASRLMVIVGHFGKACDFEGHLTTFKGAFSWYKGNSVAGLMVEVLCPFTSPKQPLALRQAGLEAVCMMCQSSPKMLLREDVVTAFEFVFKDHEVLLEEALLIGLDGFFSAGELSESAGEASQLRNSATGGNERLGNTYLATDQDGASTSIARRFLPQILRIALSSEDELSFIASKIIISVNRQGLVHPKESGPALVALETCPNVAIANMAFIEHKAQHSKHESFFDKEYMRAVQQAYEYQRDVIGSTAGYTGQPPVSKMHLLWEVLKSGKAQVRKKFLNNVASKLDFDLANLSAADATSTHLSFVQFCVENLAFFEYDHVEELVHLLTAMEKVFSATGTSIAQIIESEVLQIRVDATESHLASNGTSETLRSDPAPAPLVPGRLLQLAVAAQICSLIWETRSFLRRLWHQQKYLVKPKNAAKDSNRAPTRATNAPLLTDAFLKRVADVLAANATSDTQHAICGSFVELISVDSEVKVGSEEEDNAELENGYDTPSEGVSRKSPSLPPSGGGRGKKRKSVSATATPRKRGRPSTGRRKSGSAKLEEDGDGVGNKRVARP